MTPIEYIENLKFLPSAGPIRGRKVGPLLLPFQKQILSAALIDKKNVFIGHSRKISKTLCFGWIAQALMDTKEGQTIICAASTAEQADLVFNVVRRQIETNKKIPEGRYNISRDRIQNKKTHSIIHRLHSKAMSALGLGPDTIICDELGAWPNGELMHILTSGMGMSEAPLILTASNPAPNEVHWSVEWVKALKHDSDWKVFDYGADYKADPFDEKAWGQGNPFLKHYFKNKEKYKIFKPLYDFFQKEAEKAKKSGELLTSFRRYLLGQKIAENASPWILSEDIKGCDEAPLKNKEARWIFGFDLAYSRDFCCGALVGFYDDKIYIFPIMHLANTNQRRGTQAKILEGWDREGFIKIQNRPEISRDFFIDDCKNLLNENKITPDYFVFDRSLSEGWHQELTNKAILMRGTPFELTNAIRYLEGKSKANKIFIYKRNPALLWMTDNCIVNQRAKGYCILNRSNWRASIDGAVAFTLATAQHLKEPSKPAFFMDVI